MSNPDVPADERQPSSQPMQGRHLPGTGLVAPLWHTVVVVVVILAISAAGSSRQHLVGSSRARIVQYLFTLCWEWALLLFCLWGTRKAGVGMRQLVGGRWREIEDVLIDLLTAAGFWLVAMVTLSLSAWALGLGGGNSLDEVRRQLEFLVPRSTGEILLWIALSITAGVCEEAIFRGYLQRQFAALAGNIFHRGSPEPLQAPLPRGPGGNGDAAGIPWIGIAGSALIFGAAHGYEGGRRMMLIGIYGAMFGLLAYFRRSLRPGMLAHAFHDTVMGLLLRFFLK